MHLKPQPLKMVFINAQCYLDGAFPVCTALSLWNCLRKSNHSWGISILDVAHPGRNILWMLGQDMGITFENSRKRPFRLYFGHFAQNTQRICRRNPEIEISQDFRVEVTFPKRLGRVRGTKLLGLLRHRQNKLPTPF